MAWPFNKKESEKKPNEVPRLPELPKLPELSPPPGGEKVPAVPISQLPAFPTNSIGEKFSQDTIKKAVTGKKEGERGFMADDFAPEAYERRMMQKPLKKPLTREVPSEQRRFPEIPEEFEEAAKIVRKAEPVFIRIDKFEDSLKTFENIQKKVMEIEGALRNIQKIKEEEGTELESWEDEIQNMKQQVEKVDKDIFSKIE